MVVDNQIEKIIKNIAKNIYDKYSYIIEKRYSDWDIDFYCDVTLGNMVVVFEDDKKSNEKSKLYLALPECSLEDYNIFLKNPFHWEESFNEEIRVYNINAVDFSPIVEKLPEISFWYNDESIKSILYIAFLIAHEFGHILDSVINGKYAYVTKEDLNGFPELDIDVSENYDDCHYRWIHETDIALKQMRRNILSRYDACFISEDEMRTEIYELDCKYRMTRHEGVPDILAINILNGFSSLNSLTN